MVKRKIIKIDQDLCTGCGECITACAEGAIVLEGGKAKVVSDRFCDGLGACLKECPVGALKIEVREAEKFDEEAAMIHSRAATPPCQASISLIAENGLKEKGLFKGEEDCNQGSMLSSWPIQMRLVSPRAPFLKGASLLVAADCTGFACPVIHQDFIRGRVVLTGCPKLDEVVPFLEKLTEIIKINDIKDITILYMEVPCCSSLSRLVSQAVKASGKDIPINRYIIVLSITNLTYLLEIAISNYEQKKYF